MEQLKMNMPEYSAFDMMPLRYSKHQTAFGKYAASQAASASHTNDWSPVQSSVFFPNTPNTPGVSMTIAPQSLSTNSTELLTPESLQNYLPHELATAGNSPLFDELDMGDMQSWESLFVDEDLQDTLVAPTSAAQIGMIKPEMADHAVSSTTVKAEHYSPQPEAPHVDMTGASPVFSTVEDGRGIELNNTFDFSILDQVQPKSPHQQAGIASASQAISHSSSSHSSSSSPSISKAPRGGVTKEMSCRSAKVDDLGITIYKRKPRTTPLKPVEIPTDGDDVSAKRAKNTEAARRSRARKLERMSQLEERLRLLMDENEALRAEIAALRENQR